MRYISQEGFTGKQSPPHEGAQQLAALGGKMSSNSFGPSSNAAQVK